MDIEFADHAPHPLAVSAKWYARLLCLYPSAFRRTYGHLMAQTFCDLGRDLYRQYGSPAFIRLWFWALRDLATSVPARYLDTFYDRRQWMTKKQQIFMIVSTAFPPVLGLILALFNPKFMGRMIVWGSWQPLGWIIIFAIPVLLIAAYFVQRRGWEMLNQTAHAAQSAPAQQKTQDARRSQAMLALGIALALLALCLITFGPALLRVLEIRSAS